MLSNIRKQDVAAIGYGALFGLATFFAIAVISVDTGLGSYLEQVVPGWMGEMSFGGRFLHAIIVGQLVGGLSAGFLYEVSPLRAMIRGYLSAVFGYLIPATMTALFIGFSMFGVPRGPYLGLSFIAEWFVGFVMLTSPVFLTACLAVLSGRVGQYIHKQHLTPSQIKQRIP